MDEAQIQLMIQNVVAAALKAQSAILDKRFKELEEKLALNGILPVKDKRKSSSFEIPLSTKKPSYVNVTKDIHIRPIFPCPSLSGFPCNCLRQSTYGLNQTIESVSNNIVLSQDNSTSFRCESLLQSALNQKDILLSALLIIELLKLKIANNHSFWKIYPPPKIIK